MIRPHRLLPLLLLALAACGPKTDPQAEAAARAAERERAAEELARQFEQQVAAGNWVLARAHGEVLLAEHPKSAAAKRIAGPLAEAKAKSEAEREDKRMAALWAYQSQPVGKREQLSASILARDPVSTGGGQSRPRLIFRDHPEWGRSSYLVLENGDFDCYGGCRVEVAFDGKARRMAATRPDTDEAIAMFIEDERALWRAVKEARTTSITIPVKGGGRHEAVFETGGLDPSRLPGW